MLDDTSSSLLYRTMNDSQGRFHRGNSAPSNEKVELLGFLDVQAVMRLGCKILSVTKVVENLAPRLGQRQSQPTV